MKVLTAEEMRDVDRLTTERHGVPSVELMENAGRHVAQAVLRFSHDPAGRPAKICVLCGKGNNGGDGLVAARHLGAAQAKVYLFGKPEEMHGDAAANLHRWNEIGGKLVTVRDVAAWDAAWPEIARADVIVDAIFGTGFRGAASGPVAKAIEDVNRVSQKATAVRPPLILAVDTPSGLPSDGQAAEGPVLYAHRTVTFTAPKPGQLISPDASAAGFLDVVDIGSSAALTEEIGKGALRWSEPSEFAPLPLLRTVDSHKGLYGHVLVVAGSVGKSGAAIMSGHAALCAGAGLVTIATPDAVLPIVAGAHPEYMTEPLLSTKDGTASKRNIVDAPPMPPTLTPGELDKFMKQHTLPFERIQEGKTVLAVGPGLGQHPETQEFIRGIVRHTERPVILDADGLNAFAGHAEELRQHRSKFLAITPHPGEMARLLDVSTKAIQQDRVAAAQGAAERWNVHVVLKGSHTVIAEPSGKTFVNTNGNPGLAKGGSGDVLTGLLAALTAQFRADDWGRVLALGVYLHGAAAEIATAGTDVSGLLAEDVSRAVPHARHRLVQELQRRG
jgi:ADP-dependent NAD(P)H-hydrate dehydratase / NAD(P)H-hydrate epimerase